MPIRMAYRPKRFVLLQPGFQIRTVTAHLKRQPEFNRLHGACLHATGARPAGGLVTDIRLHIFFPEAQIAGANALASRLRQSLASVANSFINKNTHGFKGLSTMRISSVSGLYTELTKVSHLLSSLLG